MHSAASALLKRLEVALGASDSLANIAKWLELNTELNGMPWNYKHHEYQVDIANDVSRRLVVKKCSQVGLSELLTRKILAFLNIERNIHAIYTLPSSKFAQKFVKSRFDPVIAGSEIMKENLNPNVDSTEMKQFGSNFLYVAGTYGQTSAISIPATMVIRDETNFCDPVVLTTYASRLRHAEDGGYLWDFSTPTVEGFGVSKTFDQSDQHLYLCKCHCGYEDVPDFGRDMVVPGFDKSADEFVKMDLQDPGARFDQAVMLCPHCRNPWPLSDPSRRRWVDKHPDVHDMRGYWVRPWDVPHFNSAPVIFQQANSYETHQDWNNFVLGNDYSDSQNSFQRDAILNNTVARWVEPGSCSGSQFVAGMDVGKTSWLTVSKKEGANLIVVYLERIVIEGDGTNISDRGIKVAKAFGVSRMIVDAAPDFTTALRIVEGLPVGVAYACYYTKTDQRKLSNISEKDSRVIHVNRTKSLNELCKSSNGGFIKYPQHSETKLMKEHLLALKRVDQKQGVEGEVRSFWVNTAPDHYGHSLNYCNVASQTLTEAVGLPTMAALPKFGIVKATSEIDPYAGKKMLSSEKVRRAIFNGRT